MGELWGNRGVLCIYSQSFVGKGCWILFVWRFLRKKEKQLYMERIRYFLLKIVEVWNDQYIFIINIFIIDYGSFNKFLQRLFIFLLFCWVVFFFFLW